MQKDVGQLLRRILITSYSILIQLQANNFSRSFSITALGASGGSGAKSVGESNGAYVHGKFNLSKGQKIHILVGQKGWNSCSQVRCSAS